MSTKTTCDSQARDEIFDVIVWKPINWATACQLSAD